MTEIDDFARLRPPVDRLDPALRATLRAELFPPIPAGQEESVTVMSGAVDPVQPLSLPVAPSRGTGPGPGRRRRRRVSILAGTAVMMVIGAASGWGASGSSGSELRAGDQAGPPSTSELPFPIARPGASSTVPASEGGTVSLGPEPVPLVGIDRAGWSLTYASIRTEAKADLVLADPEQGIDGPVVTIRRSGDGLSVAGDEPSDVTINGQPAVLSAIGGPGGTAGITIVAWDTGGGEVLRAEAREVDGPTLLELASAIVVDPPGELRLSRPVAGLVPVDEASVGALSTYGSYGFTSTDGQTLEVRAYPGGSYLHAVRIGGEERRLVPFHGEDVPLQDYGHGSGRYRVNLVRGFWAWEFDGERFADSRQFLDLIDGLMAVDEETWNRSLPADIIGPRQRPAAVSDLVARLPVPDRFDVDALAIRPVTDRQEALAGEVVEAVSCAWLDTWLVADREGDDVTARAATEALATIGRSAVLQEAGAYGEGLPERLGQMAATLPRSDAATAEQFRSELACGTPR